MPASALLALVALLRTRFSEFLAVLFALLDGLGMLGVLFTGLLTYFNDFLAVLLAFDAVHVGGDGQRQQQERGCH
jgi:hypothetical protein